MPINPALWPPVHLGQQIGKGMPIFNRWHPLASGVIAAYMPAAFPSGTVVNMATPGLGDLTTRTGTAVNMTMTPDGMGVAHSGTTGTDVLSGPLPTIGPWRGTTGQSLFVRGQKTATAANGTQTILVGVTTNATPFNCYGIGFGGSGAGGGGAITVYQTVAGSAQVGSIVPLLNSMFDAGASMFPGNTSSPTGFGNGPGLWVNGVKDVVASPATVNITYPGTLPIVCLGEANNSGRTVAATITTGYIWGNRLLGSPDYLYLHLNPYCLWLWPADLTMAQIVGHAPIVPPVVPISKSMVVAPMTLAALGGGAALARAIKRNRVSTRRRVLRWWE
jgi:hypothetical protein